MKYNAVVVGLGKIGVGFDLKSKPQHILTHTKAFLKNSNFNLVAGVDIDSDKRRIFDKFSGKKAYRSIEELRKFNKSKIDIISLCTPENIRLSEFRKMLILKPKLVIIEKPIAMSIREASKIKEMAWASKINIFVNYIRRADPFFVELKNIVNTGGLGDVELVKINYSGGLYKNAAHFIDIMLYYFGRPRKILCLSKKRRYNGDIDASFILSFSNFDIHFQDVSDKNYSVGEIDFFLSLGRITVLDFGAKVKAFRAAKDPVFPGFNALKKIALRTKPQLERYQDNVVKHIFKVLGGKEPSVSDAKSAIETLIICKKIESGHSVF